MTLKDAPTSQPSGGSVPDGPVVSAALGYDRSGAARDRAGRFTAAGLGWPEDEAPEDRHARVTDYPFSVDVSDNNLLVALDSAGRPRRAVVADAVEDVRGRAIPGVYIHKQLSFWQGLADTTLTIGTPGPDGVGTTGDVRVVGAENTALEFLDGVVPCFTQVVRGVEIRRTLTVVQDPIDGESDPARTSALVELLEVTDTADSPRSVRVAATSEEGPSHDLPVLLPQSVIITPEGANGADIDAGVLAPGESVRLGVVRRFAHGSAGADASALADVAGSLGDLPAVERAVEDARSRLPSHLGRLEVPEDPWNGEVLTRAAELARQAMLRLPNGDVAGSFWGSNANPLPDVWTRDFGYSAMGLLESDPTLAAGAIDFLARYGLPEAPWEREVETHPGATGLQHSLGNACLAVVLADMFAQRHGRDALEASTTALDAHVPELAAALLAERPGPGGLYRTLYISDGPSRGDFHIGSNILAWRAAVALSTTLADHLDANRAAELAEVADELRAAILDKGVRTVDGNEMFVEGAFEDGQFVRVHDGEESDLTLASVYGFVDRDDPRIRAHAQWAQSVGDPYFGRVNGGIDFWDWDDYNGITYPGHIHMLSTGGTRKDLAAALRAIRETTDADGSFWWWPFKHLETEPDRAKRGLGKCGWCAGEFVSFMLHDVLGIRRDHDARTVTVAPYTPWERFTLSGLAFGNGSLDVAADSDTRFVGGTGVGAGSGRRSGTRSVTVTNHTQEDLTVTLQVCLDPDDMIEDVRLDDENYRYQSEVVSAYDAAAVRGTTALAPGQTRTLTVAVDGGPTMR
jgi:hypothetical protein